MLLRQVILTGEVLLMTLLFASVTCVAADITVAFEDDKGISLFTSSVTVIKANAVQNGDKLRITGQLKRPYPLPMAGHLHVYLYAGNGDLFADSKHRVSGLNSGRKGMLRVPFKISIKETPVNASKVFLRYHSPGHSEG